MDEIAKYFGKNSIGDIKWAQAVNSKRVLDEAVANPNIDFLETDISLDKYKRPIAAHYHNESDLTFVDLLNVVKDSNKGLKLDFKDQNAVVPSLEMITALKLSQPVILNADILSTKDAPETIIEPRFFIDICSESYPHGLLSLGWRTTPESRYEEDDIMTMLDLCKHLSNVTFPVRASILPTSWKNVKKLLEKTNYTLTIWDKNPPGELKKWLSQNTNPVKCFYAFSK